MLKLKLFSCMVVIGLFFGVSVVTSGKVEATSLPPWPYIYSGSVTVDGSPAPDGALLTAKIGTYTSVPVTVSGGRYVGLAVGAPDVTFINQAIVFYLDDVVTAAETDIFEYLLQPELKAPFDLTFPAYPTPTPTPSPSPTASPIPTATPDVPGAMILSGVVEVDEGDFADLEGKEVVARVGSYFSEPVILSLNYGLLVFDGLSVDPMNHKFIGGELELFVDGISVSGNGASFQAGGSVDLALRISVPEPTPSPSVAATAPVVVEPVPVATNVPVPTATLVPPPTAVPQPTASVPAVEPVVLVVTATPDPSVESGTNEEASGGCNLPGPISFGTGAANTLMMVGPLLLVGALRGMSRRNRG